MKRFGAMCLIPREAEPSLLLSSNSLRISAPSSGCPSASFSSRSIGPRAGDPWVSTVAGAWPCLHSAEVPAFSTVFASEKRCRPSGQDRCARLLQLFREQFRQRLLVLVGEIVRQIADIEVLEQQGFRQRA